jgi:hypothetical protein
MGEIVAAAWRVFGPAVFSWTVQQLEDWWLSQGGSPGPLSVGQDCRVEEMRRACSSARLAAELDPDQGVFYWDLPYKEQ